MKSCGFGCTKQTLISLNVMYIVSDTKIYQYTKSENICPCLMKLSLQRRTNEISCLKQLNASAKTILLILRIYYVFFM